MKIRLFVAILTLFSVISCANTGSQRSSSSTVSKEKIKKLKNTLFILNTPYYGDSTVLSPGTRVLIKKLKKEWPEDTSFPTYSRSLSTLAIYLGKFNGKPLTPSSLADLSLRWGITTPWIIQSYYFSSEKTSKNDDIWIGKTLLKYLTTHGVTHFGFSKIKSGKKYLFILLMQKRSIHMAPIPKLVPLKKPVILMGKISKEISGLEFLISSPTLKKPQRTFIDIFRDSTFKFTASFCNKKKDRGIFNIELMGTTNDGPVVLAEFPVFCGSKAKPKKFKPVFYYDSPTENEDDFSSKLLEKINIYRVNQGFKPLRTDNKLMLVAKNHSLDMCKTEKLMHISPTKGNPQERVENAKIKNINLLAENIAIGNSVNEIIKGWIKSQSHRINLQLPNVTRAGIGVCHKNSSYYTTLLLAD